MQKSIKNGAKSIKRFHPEKVSQANRKDRHTNFSHQDKLPLEGATITSLWQPIA